MSWKTDLRKFEANNYSGSAELLDQYMDILLYWLDREEMNSPKERSALTDHIRKLMEIHNTLFVLVHFYNQAIRVMNEDQENWTQNLLKFIREYRDYWSTINTRLAMQAMNIIELNQKVVLIHSQSSAVKEFFEQYTGSRKKLKVYQTEARPVMEGRLQATAIGRMGFDVTLVPDVGFARHLDKINIILLGADSVYRNYFVNKAGSYNICLAGKNSGIPIYVLADSRKFWSNLPSTRQEMEYFEQKKPETELWEDPHDGLNLENYYFEKVPLNWVDGFITETEILKASQIENMKATI